MTPEEMTEELIQANHWNFINGADKQALRKRTTELFRAAFNAGLEEAMRIVEKRAAVWRGKDGDCAMSLEEECEDISAAIDRARLSQKEDKI